MSDLSFLTFEELIARFFQIPGAEVELRRRYESRAAVMVVDFTSMVRRTDAEGIVYALALARAAEQAMAPAVVARGGEIVKRVADTFFAVFRDAGSALAAAEDGLERVRVFNAPRKGKLGDGTRNEPIHGCIGLGFGTALVIPGVDLYGEEVNRAFVLGEDLAGAGEVLATPAFLNALGPAAGALQPRDPGPVRLEEAGFPFFVLVPGEGG